MLLEDDLQITKTLDFSGTDAQLKMPAAAATAKTGAGTIGTLSIAFVLADITAGSKNPTTLPAGAIVKGCLIKVTTPLTFSSGDTTNVTLKVGPTGDDDGFHAATALAGTAGNRYPSVGGAMIGCATAGGADSCILTFTASAGGSPDLADVSAGAGTVYVSYEIPA